MFKRSAVSAPFALFFAMLMCAGFSAGAGLREIVIDSFSDETTAEGIPKGWESLTFKKVPNHTQYSIAKSGADFFVKAVSRNSSSAIFKQVGLSAKEFSVLKWRWKIENVLIKSNAAKKSGDDYAARIYVAFKYDPAQASLWEKAKYGAVKQLYGKYPPKGALVYVWDNKLPVGTALDNAYTDRAKIIVIESGKEKAGQWVSEERNIYQDYLKLFGQEPPEILFVAVMSDTDNTGESTVAYFDDISLGSK